MVYRSSCRIKSCDTMYVSFQLPIPGQRTDSEEIIYAWRRRSWSICQGDDSWGCQISHTEHLFFYLNFFHFAFKLFT